MSQLTIINFSQLISDPAYAYLFKVYQVLTIQSNGQTSFYTSLLLAAVFISSIVFFYSVITLKKKSKFKQLKSMYMKHFGLIVFTFRVFLVKNLSQISYLAYQKGNFAFSAPIAFAILLILIKCFLFQQFCTQISLIIPNKSLMSKNYHFFNGLSEILLLLILICVPFASESNILQVSILSSFLAIAFILKLLSSALRKKYESKLMQFLQRFTCMSGAVFYLSILPGYLVQLLKENLFLTMIAMLIFCYASYTNFLTYFNEGSLLFIQSRPKTKQQLLKRQSTFYLSQAHYLMHYINYLMIQYKGQEQQVFLGSILAQHLKECKNSQCYCHGLQSENKKKLIMDSKFRSKFLLSFIQNIYKEFNEQFDIFVLYLMFKLQIVGIFPQIEYFLMKFEASKSKSLKIYEQYTIFQIKKMLKKYIKDKNNETQFVRVEKALIEQQNAKKILQKLKEIVDLNIKKYKLLSQGICNLNLVQENVQKTSQIIKEIELKYLESKKQNQYNLYTQNIFYFYYTKICQTNSEASYIFSNIYTKSNYLKCLKGMSSSNLQKFLYEDRCCVIQSNLDPENMGVITNLTANCHQTFGLKKIELLLKNVKKIIPKFMNDQHELMMSEWIKQGAYRTVNQQKISFAMTNKNVCFRAMVYLQISPSFERIKMYTMVLKLPGENYLLLDRNMKIQGYGQKIKDTVFSTKVLQEPLKNFCLNYRCLPDQIQEVDEQKKSYFNIVLCQQKQCVGQIKNNNQQLNLVQKIQQFANKALNANRQIRVLKCKIQLSVMKFGKTPYYVIKFLDVTEITMLQQDANQLQQQSDYIRQQKRSCTGSKLSKKKLLLGQNSFVVNNNSGYNPEGHQGTQQNLIQEEQNSEQNSSASLQKSFAIQQIGQSTSSMMSQEIGYSFKKLIKFIKQKFLFQKNVTYHQLNNITLVLLVLMLILIMGLVIQYILYKSKLQNFQNIMIATQQVSNTLQQLELMVSQILLVYQNCILNKINDLCQNSLQSISFSNYDFYEQVSRQFSNIQNLKAAGDFGFYEYLKQPVEVRIGKRSQTMQIQKFMQVFYYSVRQLIQYFKLQNVMNKQSSGDLDVIIGNWNVIVDINHSVLSIYQQKGLDQINAISVILYSITGLIALLNFLIVFFINYFINKSVIKKQNLVRNYQWIPISYIQQMKKYFQSAFQALMSKNLKSHQEFQYPNIDDNSYYRPKSQFFYVKSPTKRILILLIFFSFLTMGNFISLYEMTNVLQPFQQIFVEEKSMIDSQKKIIQAYYTLKINYLVQKNSQIRQQKLKILESTFQKKQIQFNDRSLKLLNFFKDSTNNYFKDFKELLSGDVCEISKKSINEWEYNACKNAYLAYPRYGIFSTMIYIQRVTMIAFENLKQAPLQIAPIILGSTTFLDVDLYIIYSVRVFQIMQKRISQEMQTYLDKSYQSSSITITFQAVLLLLGVLIWIFYYSHTKKQFIKLYGHAMIFPNKIIKKNKRVMKQIQEGLVIKEY